MAFNSTTAKAAVHRSWAKTTDRTARTAAGREAQLAAFVESAIADGDKSPEAIANAKAAFYYEMAAKGVAARVAKRKARADEASA